MNGPLDEKGLTFPEVIEQPVMWGYYRDLHQADGYKALVDADTGKVFSIVSEDYKLIRHEQAIEQVEDAIHENPSFGRYDIQTITYNDGGRMCRKYIFSDISVKIREEDAVNPELQLFNSYDKTFPFILILGAFRLICSNGLVVGEQYLHVRKRHIYHFDAIDIKNQLSTAIERFELQTYLWKQWAVRQLTLGIYNKIMDQMKYGTKAVEEIEEKIETEAEDFTDSGFPVMSLWAFYNIMTWYITYRSASLNHRVEMEKRLRSAIRSIK